MDEGSKEGCSFPGKEILFNGLPLWREREERGRHRTEGEILTWIRATCAGMKTPEALRKMRKSYDPPPPAYKSVSTWGLITINILPANMSKKISTARSVFSCAINPS